MIKLIAKVSLAILVSYLVVYSPFGAANDLAISIKNQPIVTPLWHLSMMLPIPVTTFLVAVRNR